MGRYSRLGKNTVLVFFGTAGSKLLNLLMLPFYTTWLTVADYGSVDLITTYSGLMLGIISCCISDSLFIFPKSRPIKEQKEYFSSGLSFWLMSSILTGIGCAIAKASQEWCNLHGFIIDYLWVIYGVLIVSYIQGLLQQFLRAIDKMWIYSSTGIVMTVSTIVLSLILIPGRGVMGYIYALIFSNISVSFYSLICGRLWEYFSIRSISRKKTIEMLHYSIPTIPNTIMWFLMNSLNRPVLESWTGLIGVGIFAVAGRIPNLLNSVYLLFHNAWMISVLEEAKKADFTDFYNRMLKFVVITQSLLAVALAAMSEWIIHLFTKPDYYSAWQYIPLLVIGVIFMNVSGFVAANFAITRESKYYFYSSVWVGIVSIILNFSLIPIWGLWGACWAIIISQAVCMSARIAYSWKIVQVTNPYFYLKNLIFLVVSIGVCILFHDSILKYLLLTIMVVFFYYINKNSIWTCLNLVCARIRR